MPLRTALLQMAARGPLGRFMLRRLARQIRAQLRQIGPVLSDTYTHTLLPVEHVCHLALPGPSRPDPAWPGTTERKSRVLQKRQGVSSLEPVQPSDVVCDVARLAKCRPRRAPPPDLPDRHYLQSDGRP